MVTIKNISAFGLGSGPEGEAFELIKIGPFADNFVRRKFFIEKREASRTFAFGSRLIRNTRRRRTEIFPSKILKFRLARQVERPHRLET